MFIMNVSIEQIKKIHKMYHKTPKIHLIYKEYYQDNLIYRIDKTNKTFICFIQKTNYFLKFDTYCEWNYTTELLPLELFSGVLRYDNIKLIEETKMKDISLKMIQEKDRVYYSIEINNNKTLNRIIKTL